MAKWYGKVGYEETSEVEPYVWEPSITEREYAGEVYRNHRRLEGSQNINDSINVNMEISIVADPYAYQNFHAIRYVSYMNQLWKVTSVEVQYPRLILSIGGIYNEEHN